MITHIPESDPKVSLHGGPKGFDDVDWDVLHPSQATLFSDSEKVTIGSIPSSVVFSYTSPDGDQGFPGTLKTEVLVGLVSPGQAEIDTDKGEYHLGSILLVYRARLLEENKVTPVNLTQVSLAIFVCSLLLRLIVLWLALGIQPRSESAKRPIRTYRQRS
jgi:aldose 1-epimerase